MEYGISITFGNDILGVILGILLFLIAYLFYYRKKQYSFYQLLLLILSYIYITMVIGVTMTPIPLNMTELKYMQNLYSGFDYYNLDLLRDIVYMGDQFLLNIVLFVPFGILFPLRRNKINYKAVLLASFLFSLGIELSQLGISVLLQTPAWFFDVDDILANVLGGMLGCFIVKMLIEPVVSSVMKQIEEDKV
ncbi:MAG: VanZ family protein [Merdibacter sp.]|nr:VanZ family protein [Merdibacter sp.]